MLRFFTLSYKPYPTFSLEKFMTTNISEPLNSVQEDPKPGSARNRTVIAIVLAALLLGIGVVVFLVGAFGAVFMTDSCSGDSIGTVWEIWVVIVWPLLMLVGSLLPSFLYIKNKRWPVILLTILICGAINAAWYFSLGQVLIMAGC
jgi:hypothetical protein